MKSTSFKYALTLLLLCAIICARACAETRNIYVGDIVTLEFSSRKSQVLSEEELRQKFKDFEIVEIVTEQDGSYKISIRTFDAGERTIPVGDKEIVINVVSTLDDINREDIFDGEQWVIEAGIPFHWRILFYIASSTFALSGCFVLVGVQKKRIIKPERPYRAFLRRSGSLLAEDDNYFVFLTYYFKEYLENLFKRRLIGKTSAEIMNELKDISELDTKMSDIRVWLTKCDMMKFSGAPVSIDDKCNHYKHLLSLAEKIEIDNNGITA